MLSNTTPQNDPVIACDPSPISAEQRERWMVIVKQLYGATEEIRGLPDGYALRLPNSSEMLLLIAEDLNMERLCCPFLRYTVEIEPQHGPFWLHMTGGNGVKEFLRIAFESGRMFEERVARAAGLDVSAARELDSVATTLETIDAFNARFAATVAAAAN